MRSKNATINLVLYVFFEIVSFGCGLIFPRLIIGFFGSEINGLTATISRILSLITLIQAGAVGAAIFQMYKPVAENDNKTQSEIIYSSKRFYKRISIIYLVISIGIGIFYSFYLQSKSLSFYGIFLSFTILAINGFNVLLFNSICDIFVSSHQKRYFLSISLILELIVRYGAITVVLVLKLHYLFLYLSYFLGGLTSVLFNLHFYRKLSAGIIDQNPEKKDFEIPNRRFLMISSIGAEAINISPSIIITTFVGLVASSVFSVYALVYTSIKTILNSVQLSLSAIFGNLTKTADDSKIYSVYSFIELFTILMGTIASACVAFLIIPFIKLYTAGITDANYLYDNLAFFVIAFSVIFTFRTSFGYVSTVYGLFKDTCYITLFFGGAGIIISLLSVVFLGMPYVMIGILFNELGCSITNLFVLKRKISWFKIKRLLIRSSLMVVLSAASIVSYLLFDPVIDSWLVWLLYAVFVSLTVTIIMCLYCIIFEKQFCIMLYKYLKGLFMIKKRRLNI